MMSYAKERLDAYMAESKAWVSKLEDLQRWGLECKDGDFVPSVHYPPITQYPLSSEEEVFAGYTLPPDGRTDLYVHFPFCQQHCTFCHYPGLTGPRPEEKERYLRALEKVGADKVIYPEREMALKLAQSISSERMLDFIELSSEYGIAELNCPARWVGKTLVELRIRPTYGVTILAVKVHGSDIVISPGGEFCLSQDDVVMVLGSYEQLNTVQAL